MKRLQRALFWIVAVLFLAGCAATAPTVEKKEVIEKRDVGAIPPAPPVEERMTLPLFEDRALLSEGIALLNRPDPTKARAVFASLLQRFPQSRWRSAAETFVRLIDESEASREASRQDQLRRERVEAERSRALKENETLKKTVRELTEKLQTGTAALTQENEQLKKDLQRLKTLEIELEKRERMLR